jgi:hypothetical protein
MSVAGPVGGVGIARRCPKPVGGVLSTGWHLPQASTIRYGGRLRPLPLTSDTLHPIKMRDGAAIENRAHSQQGAGMDHRHYESLIVAMLSVNNYPLEKTWKIRAGLEKEGLFDPKTLASLSLENLFERLRRAGYDRGEFLTDLLAARLQSAGEFLVAYGIDNATRALSHGSAEDVQAMLKKVRGIGPSVVRNFLLLRGQ